MTTTLSQLMSDYNFIFDTVSTFMIQIHKTNVQKLKAAFHMITFNAALYCGS